MGRLISDKFHLPFVDSIEALATEFRVGLELMAELPRSKGRMVRKEFEDLIVRVCDGHFITISTLAGILNRGERTLRQDYLSKLCKEQRLRRAFPDTPNHEKQAYTKA
jgi:ATP-dependent DNA helicase RecG